MNYFIYWTNQVTPFAEQILPILTVVFMVAFFLWIYMFLKDTKKGLGTVRNSIEWKKIPLTIIMLIHAFEHTFIPESQTVLSWILLFAFLGFALSWLRDYYRPVPELDSEDSETPS